MELQTPSFWYLWIFSVVFFFFLFKKEKKQTQTHTPPPQTKTKTKTEQGCHLFVADESFCIVVKIYVFIIQICNGICLRIQLMTSSMLYFRTHPVQYLQSSPGWYFQLLCFSSLPVNGNHICFSLCELGNRDGLQVFSCKCVKGKFFSESKQYHNQKTEGLAQIN